MDLKDIIQSMKDEGHSPKRVHFNLKVKYGSVSEEALALIKEVFGLSDSELNSHLGWAPLNKGKAKAKHSLLICRSCHKENQDHLDALCALINIKSGSTSDDGILYFEITGCMGLCSLGPNAVLDQKIYNKIDDNPSFTLKLNSILEERKQI